MIKQVFMDTQTMVGMTVFAAAVLTAAVLSIRTMLNRKPVRVPVETRRQ